MEDVGVLWKISSMRYESNDREGKKIAKSAISRHNVCHTRVVKKNTILRWPIALWFFKPLCRKKDSREAVACTMIFNTALAMTNISLNSRNRLFSCSGIGLLIGFLVFHLIKISFVEPEACAIIFSTASSVNKFMKQRNKKIKNVVYVVAHAPPFSFYLQRRSTKPEICRLRACETLWNATEIASAVLSAEQQRYTENVFHILLTFTTPSPILNISIFHFFFQCRFFILLFYKFKYRWGSTKYYRTGLRFNEIYFFFTHACKTLVCAPFTDSENGLFSHQCAK